ncbi:hypothetical protein CL629_01050 [bacterium]|nr:hypothetical protein [bacterium]|tara:strand:+ start:561 stop:800 length:240 start_codon:yes stop_codon:yes gene_type:complete
MVSDKKSSEVWDDDMTEEERLAFLELLEGCSLISRENYPDLSDLAQRSFDDLPSALCGCLRLAREGDGFKAISLMDATQ